MNETAGQAVFIIKVDDSQAKSDLQSWQQSLSGTMEKGAQDTRSLSDSFFELTSNITNLATAHLSLSGTASAIGELTDSYNEYQAAMNGVKAVASATGNDVANSLQAVKDVTASGLISQADAAAAIKNLQLYGYSVEEATQMINIMTDAAVYNRQANYSVSEAVRTTTEGIRMENSVLSDASGITTNIAKMYENYAAQLGKSTNNLTQAEKAQAVYNGFLREGGVFAGNAESYTNTLAGSQQQLDTAMTQVSQTMGAVFAQFSPIIKGFADWVGQNQQLVASLGIFVGILTAGAGLVAALNLARKAITAVRTALTAMTLIQKAAIGGFVGLAVAAAAVGSAMLVANAVNSMNDEMEDLGDFSANASGGMQDLGSSTDNTAKKIAKLRQQLATLERDYRRDLKQIAVNHEENLQTLTEQIEEANVDYKRAIDERMAEFNVTMAKQERSHQETVDELMTQLAFLQRYNNEYNKQKLAQVQFALAKEEQLYKNETEKQRAEIELQNAADQEKLDKKLESLQKELDDEVAFMNKHRDILNTVRDEILLDEVESLNERFEEQKKDYQKQIAEAQVSGDKIGSTLGSSINDSLQQGLDQIDLTKQGQDLGKEMISGMGKGIEQAWNGIVEWFQQGGIVKNIFDWINPTKTKYSTGGGGGWATGGYTGRGAPDEVAGVVHRGEYVVPADQVDQNTGTPKMGAVQNITINMQGVLATSQQAKRELAAELQRALAQSNQARLS